VGKEARARSPYLIITAIGVDSQALATFSTQCGIEGFELRIVSYQRN